MRIASRLVAVMVGFAVLVAAPLRPLAEEGALDPPPPPEGSAAPVVPGPQVPQPPDLFQETLKTRQARGHAGHAVGVVLVNAFHVPGKAILCALGGIAGTGLLLVTFGSAYRATARVVEEGCGGKWVVTADDLRSDPDPTRSLGSGRE
jgi:hypothetical protein